MKKILTAAFTIILVLNSFAQKLEPAKWTFDFTEKEKDVYELTFSAKIDKGWHIYGQHIEGLPLATTFEFTGDVTVLEEVTSVDPPEEKYDSAQMMIVQSFENEAVFKALVKVTDINKIEGTVTYAGCNDETCTLPITVDFSHIISTEGSEGTSEAESKGLLGIFLIALLAGLGAILTPCVFPMIPLTVSYFMNSNTSRTKSIMQGVFYGLSIVIIYTSVGLISGLLKLDLARLISSSPVVNLVFFAVFILLAISFFGAFEIIIPGNLGNKIDQQAEKKGFLLGAFLMALATAIVSFSCTGPLVGLVLGNALRGDIITPVVGMFGFGLTFALPFTFLAIFPKAVEKLPKSGGWLNSVKVTIAFILLIFSLVFLGNSGFNFVTRDLVLILAIVLFIMMGLYLLGKFRFSHDSEVKHISIVRLLFVVTSFSMALYLIPGLFGAPLKAISPFLPDRETLTFDLIKNQTVANVTGAGTEEVLCETTPKYADKFYMPHNLKGYFDYKQGMACAKQLDKPVFLNFTGKWCKNCKKMYATVWSNPEVLKILNEDYIIISLYGDVNGRKYKLPEKEWYTSKVDGRIKKNIGEMNADLEMEKFGSNALPLYAIMDSEGNVITTQKTYTYNTSVEDFLKYLQEGKDKYKPLKKNSDEPVSLDFGW